jgi:hypothetical protein
MKATIFGVPVFVLVVAFATGCSTISTYDQAAYEYATSAKVDTLALMDKATGSYSDHQKAYELQPAGS